MGEGSSGRLTRVADSREDCVWLLDCRRQPMRVGDVSAEDAIRAADHGCLVSTLWDDVYCCIHGRPARRRAWPARGRTSASTGLGRPVLRSRSLGNEGPLAIRIRLRDMTGRMTDGHPLEGHGPWRVLGYRSTRPHLRLLSLPEETIVPSRSRSQSRRRGRRRAGDVGERRPAGAGARHDRRRRAGDWGAADHRPARERSRDRR